MDSLQQDLPAKSSQYGTLWPTLQTPVKSARAVLATAILNRICYHSALRFDLRLSLDQYEPSFQKREQLARRMWHGRTNLVCLGGDCPGLPPRGLQPRVGRDKRFGGDWQPEHGRTKRQFHLDGSPDLGVFLRSIPWHRAWEEGEGPLTARLCDRPRRRGCGRFPRLSLSRL